MEEAGQLWRLAGEALALNFGSAPGVECRLSRHGWLVATGESLPDFNCAIIGAHLDATETLQNFVGVFRARKAPFLICLTPKVAAELDPMAAELGLRFGGSLPLMALGAEEIPAASLDGFTFERVQDLGQLWEFNEASAKAFGFSPELVERVIAPGQLDVVGFDMFLLRHEGSPVSVVATTWHDRAVGIWGMGTLPEFRRKGAGLALVSQTIGYHRERTASQFFLLATAAGRPLYEKIGFQVISNGHVWQGN